MNQRPLGIVLITVGLLLAGFSGYVKYEQDRTADFLLEETGGCFLEDGTCVHSKSNSLFVIGLALAAGLVLLGNYLAFFDKTQERLFRHQQELAVAMTASKKDESFAAFLKGFAPEEQRVLKAINAQDGLKQATLRYKTGMSKAGLSLLLTKLEKQGVLRRVKDGRTNKVFLSDNL